MTKEEFLSLIRTPDEVIHQRPEAIASLVKEFPYCQALRYVYLLQLHGQNHISYAQQLKLTSAYAADRKRLHQLLHPELLMHDTTGWNENIALENEGMMDTTFEKKETTRTEDVEIPVDEPIHINQEHTEEIIDETPVYTPVNTSAKEEEEENTEVSMDEDTLSAEAIVIQRLKELNIWTEPETTSQKIEVRIPTEENDDIAWKQDEKQPNEEKGDEETILVPHGMIEENDDPDLETEIEELEIKSAQEESIKLVNEAHEIPALSSDEKELDPLEELILESIVATQVNNSDYLSEGNLEDIPAQLPPTTNDYLSEGNLEDIEITSEEKSVVIEIEPIPHQPGEKHSFAEWLHINQKTDVSGEHQVEDKKKENESSVSPTLALRQKPGEKATVISEAVTPHVPPSEVTHPKKEIHAALREEESSTTNEIVTPKMVYVKSTKPQSAVAPASTQNENSTPPTPLKFTEAVPYSPISLTPSNSDPELIPGKRPIPDPSLVDTDPPKSKVPANQLIDKFIKQEPRITPSKSAFYSPVNMAKRSIIESEDLVSETLANIYAQQGNFQKAISFYTKLSLRFPEKSRYFAALIKELENKLNT
ncbi:MAG: hypothetical protein IPK10_15450 [Bacteroidetes bacterium]|nr:hypothetical protein [Bacteroidota bacterium]